MPGYRDKYSNQLKNKLARKKRYLIAQIHASVGGGGAAVPDMVRKPISLASWHAIIIYSIYTQIRVFADNHDSHNKFISYCLIGAYNEGNFECSANHGGITFRQTLSYA